MPGRGEGRRSARGRASASWLLTVVLARGEGEQPADGQPVERPRPPRRAELPEAERERRGERDGGADATRAHGTNSVRIAAQQALKAAISACHAGWPVWT